MSLDPQGFILTLPFADVQPAFQAVIDDALAHLSANYRDSLHSVYLYGSVASGSAVEEESDLDLCLIFRHSPDRAQQNSLAALKKALAVKHPVVSKVDFDIGTLDEARAPENSLSWGFWLKHHCRCLYGQDLSVLFGLYRPSRALAWAINRDVTEVLSEYATRLSRASQPWQQRPLQRAAARKLIRATNMLRKDSDTDWPRSLEEHVERFVARYPAREAAMAFFFAESQAPRATAEAFILQLNDFRRWLTQQLG